ncbi:MAG: DUF6502 family protein [Steroidobacteraceae bacterium]
MDLKANLLAAARHMMVPIVRLLVRNGVGFGDFVEAARYAYVEGGKAVLKERGLAATSARLSVQTGLTRRDVERVMSDPMRYAIVPSREWNAAIQVLHAWHTKPPYVLVPVGMPLELEYDSPDRKQTFVALVRSTVSDVDPAAILEFLKDSRVIEQDEHGRYRPVTRHLVSAPSSAHQIRFISRTVRRLLDTVDVNVSGDVEHGRFERTAVADRGVLVARYGDFVEFIRKVMARALEDIDDWIADNARGNPEDPVIWPGVGMYHWLDDPNDEQFPLDYALTEVKVTRN